MEDEICQCECHKEGSGVMHFAECCTYCPYCDQNIIIGMKTIHHENRCKEELKARDPEMFKAVEHWIKRHLG